MFALSIFSQPYPQRVDTVQPSWLDQLTEWFRIKSLVSYRFSNRRLDAVVNDVIRQTVTLSASGAEDRKQAFLEICGDLRRRGFGNRAITARALALARIVAIETLGLSPHSVQIKGAYILLGGQVAEMDTGEGKTLTASLAAACAAMAGLKVHVITVNDYLAERDASTLAPFFSALGFTISVIQQDMSQEDKQRAYKADIVYCANKIIVFDYLRDRVALGERMRPFAMAVDKLAGLSPSVVSLPGLQFAIVDEADSVFVDEARTPLIISEDSRDAGMDVYYQQAIDLALTLTLEVDYELLDRGRFPRLTQFGRDHLKKVAEKLSGLWRGEKRREESIIQALIALHGFKRDVDYIVRDGKVMIVDENTGRVMPDRSWERGLQQLMELKEGLETTPLKKTLARLSYQIFFRRYVNLCGMTGTCREVKSELREVYGMGVVRVPPNKSSKRVHLKTRLLSSGVQRWQVVAEDIERRHERGQPVLVGTRSILASEHLSQLLTDRGVIHQVLNAKQNSDEALIVSRAGDLARVTIATNMAGRGTDIKLAPGVAEKGGLHVILTEGHDNRRVDRQLAGRCARQGDPGSWQEILSMDDELMKQYPLWILHFLTKGTIRNDEIPPAHLLCLGFYRLAQKLISAKHRHVRARLLKVEYQNRQTLSFSGATE